MKFAVFANDTKSWVAPKLTPAPTQCALKRSSKDIPIKILYVDQLFISKSLSFALLSIECELTPKGHVICYASKLVFLGVVRIACCKDPFFNFASKA